MVGCGWKNAPALPRGSICAVTRSPIQTETTGPSVGIGTFADAQGYGETGVARSSPSVACLLRWLVTVTINFEWHHCTAVNTMTQCDDTPSQCMASTSPRLTR